MTDQGNFSQKKKSRQAAGSKSRVELDGDDHAATVVRDKDEVVQHEVVTRSNDHLYASCPYPLRTY